MADDGGMELRIETDSVAMAAEQFRSIADELHEGFHKLLSSVDEVVEGSWRGEAARAFGRDWDDFRRSAAKVVEDAGEIAERVALSVQSYTAQDEYSAAIVRDAWNAT